jgi:hypothetical protein
MVVIKIICLLIMFYNYYKKKKLIDFFKKNISFCTVFIIFLFFINSLFYARNIYDPHHVNLVFVEASNFLHGKYLYKDIFVKYGILSTIINAFGLFLFGDNIFSIFLITNIFYFFSIFLLFFIFFYLKTNKYNNFFLILIILNIHSYIYVPWSNYLAFLPILLSIIFIIIKKKRYFLSGFFLALSCLFRETYFLSIIFIFFFILSSFFFNKEKKINFLFYIIGFLLPLIVFIIYMISTKNYVIWTELIYPTYKSDLNVQLGFKTGHFEWTNSDFVRYFLLTISKTLLDLRDNFNLWYFLFFLIFISCFHIIFYEFFKLKKISFKSIIAIYSLSLSIQAFHSHDVFRLICGSVVGIIIFNNYLVTLIKKRFICLVYTIFLVCFLILNWSFYFYSLDNYFKVFKKDTIASFKKIKQFHNMNYLDDIHKNYRKFSKYCDVLREDSIIKYSINYTPDSSLDYFCKTIPRNYYPWNNDYYTKIFLKSSISNKYIDVNNNNTIIFIPINSDQSVLLNYDVLFIMTWNFGFVQESNKIAIVQKKFSSIKN